MELFELMGVSVMPLGNSEELFYAQELPGQNAVMSLPRTLTAFSTILSKDRLFTGKPS